MHRLKGAKKKAVGFKQSLKAVERGQAKVLYVAKNADEKIRIPLLEMCLEHGVLAVEVDTMIELGKVCGIQVGASVAVVLDSGDSR